MANVFDWPIRIVPGALHRSVPVVDGVIINPETLEIISVKGFIKASAEVVIDPSSFTPMKIGIQFFHSAQEAKSHLVAAFRKQIEQLEHAIEELGREQLKDKTQ